jgi:hypothetical protein
MTCDKCGTAIPAGARFCAACGDPVTGADREANHPVVATERVNLVCPRCGERDTYTVAGDGSGEPTCPRCHTAFSTRVVVVRSKRAAGDRPTNTRRFTIRVHDLAGRDELIEFVSPGYDDFELKSRDLAAFSQVDGRLRVVQNLTLGRHMTIPSETLGCGAGGCGKVAGVGCLGMVAFVLLMALLRTCSGSGSSATPAPIADTPSAIDALPPGSGVAAEDLYVHAPVKVRTGPGPAYPVTRTLQRGERVRLGSMDGQGWAVLYAQEGDSAEGYVYRSSPRVRTHPPTDPDPVQRAAGGSGAASNGYHLGPRGGCYTYSASGRKRYVDHSFCY